MRFESSRGIQRLISVSARRFRIARQQRTPAPFVRESDVRRARAEIDASAFPHLPLSFTEWSTSYTPRDMVHDSYVSAPYILTKLNAVTGTLQGMSYWTFSDLLEESGPPPTPFHGGFGLLNREGIRKPAWFAYKYLHALAGRRLKATDPHAIATESDPGAVTLVAWDWHQPQQAESDRSFYSRLQPSAPAQPLAVRLGGLRPGRYRLRIRRTGYRHNDPLSAYIDMGRPASLSGAQLAKLQALTSDEAEQDRMLAVGRRAPLALSVPMRTNDVVLLTLEPASRGAS